MTHKKAVITGSAGLIGSHLAYRLLAMGYEVIGIDNLIGGYYSNMPVDSKFTFYNIDILNCEAIKHIFENNLVDVVIHCAALAHEGLSVFSPSTITNNIYSGTISVASAAISGKVPLFINTSSMARYGDAVAPFSEDTVPQPIDPYGLAKLQAEQQLNLLSKIHGIRVVHMVPHNVCGPHQCYSDPFRNVMSIFANRIRNSKPIYIYGDGEQQRSFSHVEDCVDAYIAVIDNQTIESGNIFNIGPSDGSEITITQLAHSVARHFNAEPSIINLPPRPQEVKHAWVTTAKAEEVLQYTTKHSTEDVVRDTVSWIRRSPERSFNYHLPLEIITDKTPRTWTEKLFNE